MASHCSTGSIHSDTFHFLHRHANCHEDNKRHGCQSLSALGRLLHSSHWRSPLSFQSTLQSYFPCPIKVFNLYCSFSQYHVLYALSFALVVVGVIIFCSRPAPIYSQSFGLRQVFSINYFCMTDIAWFLLLCFYLLLFFKIFCLTLKRDLNSVETGMRFGILSSSLLSDYRVSELVVDFLFYIEYDLVQMSFDTVPIINSSS